ncbi:hypothetical protein OWR29_25865 [Actinoplanes sp. Pm04-4]|uniref:Uncharacterized protein n=1 Tax=Paractinoplanes pyxinae TaxID=2997416 RepID=A0ABT4B4M1_9ACTN|nr:hypothetical protein [Actinoplanes pyxinae]MCY1141438.1 hypothetical protein [Actinoplanes pyxinae]
MTQTVADATAAGLDLSQVVDALEAQAGIHAGFRRAHARGVL